MISEVLKLLRVKHWVKNLFLFIPLFFSGDFFNTPYWLQLFLGFFAFSFTASSIYILNDYRDIEADKLHPEKSSRPLAAGTVSKKQAIFLFLLCVGLAILICTYLRPKFTFVLGIYFVMNILYSMKLKQISILDIIIVSIGFNLRVKAGSVLSMVPLSEWLIIMVFLLSLFMALAKRRDDIVLKMSSGLDMRKVVKNYNLVYLNASIAMVSSIIVVAYLMYTLSDEVMINFGTSRLFYTTLFVLAGLMRYLQLALVEESTGSPTKILYKDRFIQVTLLLWFISFYFIIYYPELNLFEV